MSSYTKYLSILRASQFPESEINKEADEVFDWCIKNQVSLLFPNDYPLQLKSVEPLPSCLFVKGNLSCLQGPSIAIVGARNASPYSLASAFRFSRELSGLGFTIVSGLALGVDGASHQGALKARGKTLAVMGAGFSCLYPKAHRRLAHQILDQEGAWLSEYKPITPPLPHHFPQRNRLISALSLGTLVVEAREKSGSLITALCSLNQGREVFVLPGPVDENRFLGAHRLIQEGAKLVTCVRDLLEELMPALVPLMSQRATFSSSLFSFGEQFSYLDWVKKRGENSFQELQNALGEGKVLQLEPQRYVWVMPSSS